MYKIPKQSTTFIDHRREGDSLGTDHYFFIGGVTIFGTCRQFFSKE